MIRPLVFAILILPLPAACGFGQDYFAPVGEYFAPALGQFQPLPPVRSEGAFPARYADPLGPFGNSCPGLYPSTGERPYAALGDMGGPIAATPPYAAAPRVAEPPSPVPADWPPTSEVQESAAGSPGLPDEKAASEESEAAEEEESGEATLEEPISIEEEGAEPWYYTPVLWFDLWDGNVELGLSGSEGNSETLNYLLGLEAKRETEEHIFDFSMNYDRKTADSVETAHRLFAEARWELLFEDSCWTWFFHETTEYDEFKAFDLRLSYDTGLGRCLIKNDDTSLLARLGGGLSHEIGSPDEDAVPEAVFGVEFKHKLSERQKLAASSEYSPDVTGFLDFRLKSKASWEVLLDEETNLSLKVSLLDRYDSTPNGKKHNDLDYTLTLLWSF